MPAVVGPVITSWHGYKISATEAELVINGSGFGSTTGVVEVVAQGGGRSQPVVKIWSDTFIRVSVAANATIV